MDGVRLDLAKVGAQGFDLGREVRHKTAPVKPFEDVLKEAVIGVNDMQIEADVMVQRLALGDVDDVSEVVGSVQKAELAFRLMVQVRDKLVDAYQQLGRMPV
ncbi:flagellar hook-basal body complex protein FliE [Dethiosulfovibrio salsuginis]|uniref:Flagellar hook-basal body complex protein FliE n=1 Tax=Dethiosulfovibrio salsuginis TaxID=561720 RepID=A0A1X7K9H0_9BACT|nr:flagellar hook-basal body complex protein FliE [Dethiosulfovibrio salsuginis]SMG37761.1 flagellar hook-basal body complex protein FliE [Dethiosulfovibrio salsuginis]